VLDVDPNRETFSRHGFHINGLGKETTSKQIAVCIKKALQKSEEKPISIC
jgi:hypothetical protein